jgi:predicted secreted protein
MAERKNRESSRRRMQRQFEEIIDSLELNELQKRFLHDRWLDQLTWFETKAYVNQRRHYILRLVTIVGGLIVPALVTLNISEDGVAEALAWVTFGLSLVVATAAALDSFFRTGERWRSFRRVAELLKAHGWQYFELSGPYQAADHATAFTTFTAQVEALIQEDLKAFIAQATQAKLAEQQTEETPAEDSKAGQ